MELAAQRVIDVTRKYLGDMGMVDKYDEALDVSLEKWTTASTPARQQPAFRDGFHEGWQAALTLALQIIARRFEVCDSGLRNGVPDGVSRDYLAGSRATCMDLTVSLEENDRVRAPRESALDRVADSDGAAQAPRLLCDPIVVTRFNADGGEWRAPQPHEWRDTGPLETDTDGDSND